MNKPTLSFSYARHWLAAASLGLLLSACSGGSSAPSEFEPTVSDNQWTFGTFTYQAETNFQTIDDAGQIYLRINDRGSVEQGLYTGALLEITLSDTEAGTYSITDQANFDRDTVNNVPVMHLTLTVGLADPTSGIATFASSQSAGFANVTQNASGQYFVTIDEPVVLSRSSATSQFDTETPQLPLTTINIFGDLPAEAPAE